LTCVDGIGVIWRSEGGQNVWGGPNDSLMLFLLIARGISISARDAWSCDGLVGDLGSLD
jgi:hypothetical protein